MKLLVFYLITLLLIFSFFTPYVLGDATSLESFWKSIETLELSQETKIIGSVRELHVDEDGDIWIVDSKSCQIKKFDKKGKLIAAIGARGKAPGEFVRPFDISFFSDNFFVTDPMAKRIHVFKKKSGAFDFFVKVDEGRNVHVIGRSSFKKLYITGPLICEEGGNKEMYCIHIYDFEGKRLKSFFPINEKSFKNELICDGAYFCHDEKYIYAIQEMDYLIFKYRLNGHFVKSFAEPAKQYVSPPAEKFKKFHLRSKLRAWISSWSHIIGIKRYKNLLFVIFFNIDREPNRYVLDIYDTDGNFIRGGLESDERLLHIDDNGIFYFLSEIIDSEMDTRFKIKKYVIKDPVKTILGEKKGS